jgi:fatty acid desaturase
MMGMIKYRTFYVDELLTFLPPTLMYLFSENSIKQTLILWLVITLIASFCYSAIAINAGHHGFAIAHEGDELKSLDFGIFQMGATIDRFEADTNIVMSLTHFGNHTLHHLFPSLDHALLPQLRPILLETCKEFDTELRRWTLLHAAIEQFHQLSRTEANSVRDRNENYQSYKQSLKSKIK